MTNSKTRLFTAFAVTTISLTLGYPTHAATVTFDFDSGAPPIILHQNIPFDQTLDGLTAHFSSPSGPAFSVQTGIHTLSQFSGMYLLDNDIFRDTLTIQFSAPLSSISMIFATVDYHDPTPAGGSMIRLEAFLGTAAVGFATAIGDFVPGDTYPQGTLAFNSGSQKFDSVQIMVPVQDLGATQFFLDTIVATTAPVDPVGAPEPGSMILLAGGLAAVGMLRRQRQADR